MNTFAPFLVPTGTASRRVGRPRLVNFIVAVILALVVTIPTIGYLTNLPPISESIAGAVWCGDATEVSRATSYVAAEQRGTAHTSLVCHTGDDITRVSQSRVSITAWSAAIAVGLFLSSAFGLIVLGMGRRAGRLMLTSALLDRALR